MFLSELVDIHDVNNSAEKWGAIITRDCKPFLKNVGSQPMYRGIKRRFISGLTTEVPRNDRVPLDSNPLAHEDLDKWFQANYGFKPRSQGMFCTGNLGRAHRYGVACYVFPIGEFKYVWFSEKSSLYSAHYAVQDSLSVMKWIVTDGQRDQEKIGKLFGKGGRFKIHTDNLKGALEQRAEVTIICKKAYLVPVEVAPDDDEEGEEFKVHYDTLIHPEDYRE